MNQHNVWSASQIQTYLDCPRKWAFSAIEHIQVPQKPSAALGEKVHKHLELYLGQSKPIEFMDDSGRIAHAALEFLPAPADHLETEHEYMLISSRGHWYYGKIDLRDPTTHTIYDHKSTSNPAFAKTEEKLPFDVQAVLYATTTLVDWETPEVNLQWTYTKTKGSSGAFPVRIQMTAEEARERFDVIEDIADEMASIKRSGKRALDLLPRPATCNAYGGCPHRHRCNLGPKDTLRSMTMSNAADDLLARLTAKKSAAETSVRPGQINPPEGENSPIPEPPAPQQASSQASGTVLAPMTPDQGAALAASLVAQARAETGLTSAEGATSPERKTRARKSKDTKDAPAAAPKPAGAIGTLYVDCFLQADTAIGVITFPDILARANDVLKTTTFQGQKGPYQITDYRQGEYGQGPAMLLEAVRQVLVDNGYIEHLSIDTNTPEAQIVLNELMARAERVVRSTR